jgi:hypothetical protein
MSDLSIVTRIAGIFAGALLGKAQDSGTTLPAVTLLATRSPEAKRSCQQGA